MRKRGIQIEGLSANSEWLAGSSRAGFGGRLRFRLRLNSTCSEWFGTHPPRFAQSKRSSENVRIKAFCAAPPRVSEQRHRRSAPVTARHQSLHSPATRLPVHKPPMPQRRCLGSQRQQFRTCSNTSCCCAVRHQLGGSTLLTVGRAKAAQTTSRISMRPASRYHLSHIRAKPWQRNSS